LTAIDLYRKVFAKTREEIELVFEIGQLDHE
jgi:hypothetical protein